MDTSVFRERLHAAELRRSLPAPGIRRLLREGAGLSQDDIARILGVSRVAVTRYESGKRSPRGKVSEDYARLLQELAGEVRT
jgi:transcriptional regulator with XRE-family HTH domain